jgi:CubicO group peptidase (beta-lactamase class C family)
MKQSLSLVVMLAVMFLLFQPGASAQEELVETPEVAEATAEPDTSPAPQGGNPELEAFVDGLIAAHLEDGDMPGAIVAVVHGDSTFLKGYGLADTASLRPVDTESMFRMGSISKTFVWTAIMMLVEEGELDLDADINQYLKDLQIPAAYDKPVTLNDLMAHRSGLEEPFGLFLEGASGRTLTETLKLHQPARVHPPGVVTTYSNWGAALGAKVVEDVTGQAYQEFLFGRILDPLGMESTTMLDPVWSEDSGVQVQGRDGQVDPDLSARLALPHRKVSGQYVTQPYLPVGPCAPAGAMSASAADMAKWMRMHLSGGAPLLSPATHALMWTRPFADGARTSAWGHGFLDESLDGVQIYRHTGSTQNFLSSMTMVPSLDFGIFISANGGASRAVVSISDAAIKYLAGKEGVTTTSQSPASAPSEVDRQFASKAAGSYLANRRSSTGFEKLFALPRITKVTARDDVGLVMTSAVGESTRLYPLGEGYYQTATGDSVYFHVNGDGDVVRMGGSETSDKVTTLFTDPKGFNLALRIAGFLSLTTLLGIWWRYARETGSTAAGRRLAVFDIVAAIVVIGFIATFFMSMKQIASMTILDLQAVSNWPPPLMDVLRALGYATASAAVTALLLLVPAWRSSGWTLFRKVHHTLFTGALLFFTLQLWAWNVFATPASQ